MSKKYLVCLIAITVFSGCNKKPAVGTNGVEFTSALQYNDFIIQKQQVLVDDMSNFKEASQLSADSAEKILNNTIFHLRKNVNDISGMPPFNGDSSFRDAAVELFSFYLRSFSSAFKEMLDINRKVETDTHNELDIARYKEIEQLISKEQDPLDAKLKEKQKRFAKINELKLGE